MCVSVGQLTVTKGAAEAAGHSPSAADPREAAQQQRTLLRMEA